MKCSLVFIVLGQGFLCLRLILLSSFWSQFSDCGLSAFMLVIIMAGGSDWYGIVPELLFLSYINVALNIGPFIFHMLFWVSFCCIRIVQFHLDPGKYLQIELRQIIISNTEFVCNLRHFEIIYVESLWKFETTQGKKDCGQIFVLIIYYIIYNMAYFYPILVAEESTRTMC